jgi:hypothetical protein
LGVSFNKNNGLNSDQHVGKPDWQLYCTSFKLSQHRSVEVKKPLMGRPTSGWCQFTSQMQTGVTERQNRRREPSNSGIGSRTANQVALNPKSSEGTSQLSFCRATRVDDTEHFQ